MAGHLNESRIARIIHLLDGWRGDLTWEALAEVATPLLGHRYTRQALQSHEDLHRAFGVRKAMLRNQNQLRQKRASDLEGALDRIERLTTENARLKAENMALLEKFASWCYNAYANPKGIPSEKQLNKALPRVDRDRSDEPRIPKTGAKSTRGGGR